MSFFLPPTASLMLFNQTANKVASNTAVIEAVN
jgi:hypothetical protein